MDEKHKVLIVDDEKSNIFALTEILGAEYEVTKVTDSRKALETAEEDMPDIILLDIIMPEMDGFAVISALKNSDKTRDIPVLFITGLDDIEAEEKGLVLGAADYISKPFHPPVVQLRIHNQIKILEQLRTIKRISLHDQLTGMPNRHSFEERLHLEWGKMLREHTPLSVLIVDVDHFKNYNDAYGHPQGDIALQSVAEAFDRALKRSSDFAARWGGEEFIVLLPNTDVDGMMIIAEEVRKTIEDMTIPGPFDSITKITASIGGNTQTHETASAISEFISEADTALYEAKKTGRNKVCISKS